MRERMQRLASLASHRHRAWRGVQLRVISSCSLSCGIPFNNENAARRYAILYFIKSSTPCATPLILAWPCRKRCRLLAMLQLSNKATMPLIHPHNGCRSLRRTRAPLGADTSLLSAVR
eukprot:2536631-Pleurochrysis_carterae.AAC.2